MLQDMTVADDIVIAIFMQDKRLTEILPIAIKERLKMSIGEFSEKSRIPASTLYKILSGERNPNLRTLRRIITTAREVEQEYIKENKFIAVIGARGVLDEIDRDEITFAFGKGVIIIKEYAVTTIEEAIIAAIQAEREGASALVCAPILSPTVEKIISIPVTTIRPTTSVTRAIELAARKIS